MLLLSEVKWLLAQMLQCKEVRGLSSSIIHDHIRTNGIVFERGRETAVAIETACSSSVAEGITQHSFGGGLALLPAGFLCVRQFLVHLKLLGSARFILCDCLALN